MAKVKYRCHETLRDSGEQKFLSILQVLRSILLSPQ